MALVMETPTDAFDSTQIARGYLLWGRHSTWKEGRAGFVTSVTKDQLIVQYYPGIGNVTNHFRIPVSEAVKGQWEIRWSADLGQIQEYHGKIEENEQETGGEASCDTGRVDL